MKYAVTVVRTGTIWVEAATPADAMQIADCRLSRYRNHRLVRRMDRNGL